MTTRGDIPAATRSHFLAVAVPRPFYQLFTYRVPAHLVEHVHVGGWVRVPFGNTKVHAFVVQPPNLDASMIPEGMSESDLKDVIEVSQPENELPPDVFELCRFASDYYFTPPGEMIQNAASPVAIGLKKPKRVPKVKSIPQSSIPLGSRETVLNAEQLKAADVLDSLQKSPNSKVGRLLGVTGSGKTEVYIELAKRALFRGEGVLILVPEIALTPQLYERFEKGLGQSIALWHSAVSDGKRYQQLEDLKKGKVRVVVGARSAVFVPIQNLGLVIVDEEHDPTYKQEDRGRYHARDLAIVRAKIRGAITVLGSATPSVEVLERVKEGKYLQAELPNRYGIATLPKIEMVDLKSEPRVEKIQAVLAQSTLQTIQSVLDSGQQVMVYLNRRGFATYLLCKECGEVETCSHCSVSLTVHRRLSKLKCHSCGFQCKIPSVCKKCQGIQLTPMGAGTESLELELPHLLKGARISRLDRDKISSTTRLSQVLEEFRRKETNLLLGTQMVVKGHDFPGVTLVVVILADALFRWPDYRASERAYQILKQVSGRAGRGDSPGRVLIQTYQPDHPVLQVLDHRRSEKDFLETERDLRKALNYPPFGRMARVRLESSNREEVASRAIWVTDEIRNRMSEYSNSPETDEILGPSEAFTEKIKGIFRWEFLVKTKEIGALQKILFTMRNHCVAKKWQFSIDVDPYGI